MKPLLLALLLIRAASAGDAAPPPPMDVAAVEPSWTRAVVPGSTVSLELPGPVEVRHAEKYTPVGKVVSDTLVVKPDGGWMAATVTHASALALRIAGPEAVLKQARSSVLGDTKGKLVDWEPVERDGMEGMRLTFTLVGEDGRPQAGASELYTVDDLVVTITAALTQDAGPTAQRMHGSVRFK